MPLPRTDQDLALLDIKIKNLSSALDDNLEQDYLKLCKAKKSAKEILQEDFSISELDIDFLDDVQVEYFNAIGNLIEPTVIQSIFDLFLRAKRVKNKLDGIVLHDVTVNKQIQPKFCKVSSLYGEGTGYIIDHDQGVVVSSFHLIGAIKPLKITSLEEFKSLEICSVLYACGYIDYELRLTKDAMALESESEMIRKITETKVEKLIIKSIKIDPAHIEEILGEALFKDWMLKELQRLFLTSSDAKERFKFDQNNNKQLKIATALSMSGFLDGEFFLAQQSRIRGFEVLVSDLKTIIPDTQKFTVMHRTPLLTEEEGQKLKTPFIEKQPNLRKEILKFFKRGQLEKDVVLLSKTVKIKCDGELLVGEIRFPEDADEEKKKTMLRNFAYFDAVPLSIISFQDDSPFMGGNKLIYTGKKIEPLPKNEEVQIGEKVYFGGYPLTQQAYTFSTGVIAAVTTLESRTCFVIEAPIAPGNSGSPVFIQRKGELYWIGVINSEVAHVSEKMLEIREKLAKTQEGLKVGDIGFLESFRELTTTLLDNLSTGKGKAFQVESVEDLYTRELKPEVIYPSLDFLVPRYPKPRNSVKEEAKKEIEARAVQRVHDKFEYQGTVYYLNADQHNNKHIKLCGKITKADLDNWKNKPATFNSEFSGNYKEVIKKVIIAIAESGLDATYVHFGKPVGWDRGRNKKGEETCVIELYYEDGIGSHIRPKAESWLSREDREDKMVSFFDAMSVDTELDHTYTPLRDSAQNVRFNRDNSERQQSAVRVVQAP